MNNEIEIKNITFSYKKGRTLFEDFSLIIDTTETTIVSGPNGSGKTTLTKLIMGILKPQFGEIRLFGDENKTLSLGQIGEKIGYVFQYPERQLFATSVMEELTFPLILKGVDKVIAKEKAETLINTFQLQKVKESYPFFLSYGEKRRLAIASILMQNPNYLILDEPTASLDSERIEILCNLLEELKKKKIGLLIISHNEAFIKRHGYRRIYLEEGRIISDLKL